MKDGVTLFAVKGRWSWAGVCVMVLSMTAALVSQVATHSNRITQEVTSEAVATMNGTVHPLTRRATDLGPVDSEMQMNSLTLNIGLSAAQQSELNLLLDAQQNPTSRQYHKWLTQEEFGTRFGLTDADLSTVKAWLQGQGFSIKGVANSRNAIYFSGKAQQVDSAFHTQLHRFILDGDAHFSNATELRIPAALAGVVTNVRGLNDFRPKPHNVRAVAMPQFTTGSGSHYIAPGDWATIYDMNPIYAGATGSGMHVGVIGQTYVPQADIDNFRRAAGLGATNLNYACISSADCTDAAGTSTDGDLFESDMDIEWAGAIAKNATVDFIYASHADATQDIFEALQYAVQQYKVGGAVVPVLSLSYGKCEQETTAGDANWFLTLGQQANAQGQTIVASSGDSGAAGCDAHANSSVTSTSTGLSVGLPAAVPNVTAVGGTIFNESYNSSAYWSSSTAVVNTALSYIPEMGWNESGSNGLLASGGGVSTFYPQPAWQTAPSNFTGTPGRFVPDVAFTASASHDGYLVCTPSHDPAYGTSCTNGFLSNTNYFLFSGGTSAGTPAFAGMLTLLAQKYGPLGNINPTLYTLASDATTYAAAFHDITSGNNVVNCYSSAVGCVSGTLGYQATMGYDLVTGLGSVDGGGLYNIMATGLTTTTLATSPSTLMAGNTVTLTATVTSTVAGNITGTVTFVSAYNTSMPLTLGTASVTGGTAILNVTANSANDLFPGTDGIMASYSGDSNFAASSGTTTLTVASIPSVTTVTATPNPVMFNNPINISVALSSSNGTPGGYLTLKVGGVEFADMYVGSNTGKATWNGMPVNASNGFSVGTDTITAQYYQNGDYASSTGTTALTVTPQPATTTTLAVNPTSVTIGSTVNLSASVTSTVAGTPTGTVVFRSGNYLVGSASLSNGTATLANYPVNANNGFAGGTDSITATYAGDLNFASSLSPVVLLQVAPIASTTALTASSSSVSLGNQIRLTAVISGSAGLTPTGTVTFKIGGVNLGMYQMSNGSAITNTILVSPDNGFTVGSNTVTATYSGDGDYNASNTNSVLAVASAPPYTITASAASISLAAGNTGVVGLGLSSGYYTGPVTLAVVSSSPAVSASAPSVQLTPGGMVYSDLTITASASAANHTPALPWRTGIVVFAIVLGMPITLRNKRTLVVILTAGILSTVGIMVACGGGSGASTTPPVKIPHTYTLTVTPTAAGTVANPAPITITVTMQ